MTEAKTVFVDVDDTLARSFGSKTIPITSVIEKLKALSTAGFKIWVWSTAGAAYSEAMCTKLGINSIVEGYFLKPALIIDDQKPENWANTKIVHPMQIDDILV